MKKSRDRLLEILIAWAIFTAVFPTILLYRAAIQPNYQWGLFGVTGIGLSPGYLVIFVTTAWVWGTVFLGQRGARPLFAVFIMLWNFFLMASIIYGIVRFGSDLSFRGDAMGIQVNLAVIGPVLFGAFFVLSVLWWLRHRQHIRMSFQFHWSQMAKIEMGFVLIFIPAIIVLFVLGDGVDHTNNDRAAIGLVVVQCILAAHILDHGMKNSMDRRTEAA